MRAELQRVAGRVRAEVGRQVGSRTDRVRAVAGPAPGAATPLHDDVRWTQQRRVPVRARVDPGLRLAAQEERARATVLGLLAGAGVRCWSLPQAEGGPDLGVDAADRDRVLAALATLRSGAWYADAVLADGLAREQPRSLAGAAALRPLRHAAGVAVHELVVAEPEGTFAADHRQGVRVLFWERDGDRLECLAANLSATVLSAADVAGDDDGGAPVVPVPLRARPVARVDFPVDVVYTWVDGEDDAWLLEKARAAGAADPALFTERAHDEARFADHDELRHSIRSLEQFAPWVNHVWVVTAGQHPSWLAEDHPWVSVVDHRAIFPGGDGLPTFNSHAIEACLHRIPGLAEHFLYLNDDMLLGRPVRADQFFHANGIGKFFWSRALVDHGPSETGDVASTTAARNARRLLEERLGVTFTRKFFHTAAALTVSGLAELEATFPEVVAATRRAQFRTLDDVALAGSFYLNWAYATGRSVPGRVRYTYIDPAAPDARSRLRSLERTRVFDAFCVNDGSSEETPEQRRETDRLIREFFAAYLPVPGAFEV